MFKAFAIISKSNFFSKIYYLNQSYAKLRRCQVLTKITSTENNLTIQPVHNSLEQLFSIHSVSVDGHFFSRRFRRCIMIFLLKIGCKVRTTNILPVLFIESISTRTPPILLSSVLNTAAHSSFPSQMCRTEPHQRLIAR